MSSVEELLRKGLEESPSNWDLRLELARKLVDKGQFEEATELVSAGEGTPSDEDQLHQALELCSGHTNSGNWDTVLKEFSTENPTSGYAHRVLSSHLLALDAPTKARKHYDAAIALDAGYVDPEFDTLLTSHETTFEGEETGPVTVAEEGQLAEAMTSIPIETGVVTVSAVKEDTVEEPEEAADEKLEAPPATPNALKPPGEEGAQSGEPAPSVPEIHEVHPEEVPHEFEIDETEGHDRFLVTQEGEAIHAANSESTRASKMTAAVVAMVVHALLIALLILVQVAQPRNAPPQVIGTYMPSDNKEEMDSVRMEKQEVQPTAQSASNQMEIATVLAASSFAVPDFDSTNMTFDPLGMGDSFGPSMSFAGEDGGSMVSFFGSKTSATKVVFVVDASASMKRTGKNGRTKFSLMQEELTRTVKSLPPGVEFQILFFSGPSWFIGEWDKKKTPKDWSKHAGGGNYWEYMGGDPEKWPSVKYHKATPSTVRRIADMIQKTPMVTGTDWRDPLKMAMNMEPDVIYFMTDGAVGKHPEKKPVVDDVLDFNRIKGKAKINSICFMVLQAYENLKELADKTQGEFTLVTEDGQILRGRDVEDLAKKKGKK